MVQSKSHWKIYRTAGSSNNSGSSNSSSSNSSSNSPSIPKKGIADTINNNESSRTIILRRLLAKMAEWHPLPSFPPEAIFSPTWNQMMQQAEQCAKHMEPAQLPSMDHLTYLDFEHVYEPSADTFLMLDAIKHDLPNVLSSLQHHQNQHQQPSTSSILNNNNNNINNMQLLEIGCGSGLGIVYLATQIQQWNNEQQQHTTSLQQQHHYHHTCLSFVTDVNPMALRVALRTAKENGIHNDLQAIQCDLASALLPRSAHSIDVLLFNPPYVPTPDDEVGGTGIEASWAGGVRGRRVIDRALPQIAQLLRPSPHGGVAYIVTVDDNDPEQMANYLDAQYGLCMRPIVRRKAHNEYLTVHRLSWKQQQQNEPPQQPQLLRKDNDENDIQRDTFPNPCPFC